MPERARDRPMTTAERRKVARQVAADARRRKLDARRQAQREKKAAILKQGQLEGKSAFATRERLREMGLAGGLQGVAKDPKGAAGFAAKVIGNITEDAFYAPAGLYEAGKAVALDVRDTARGEPTAKRTAAFGKAVAESTAETVKHPLRRPGDTLLLGLGGAGAAGGTAARVSAAAKALKAGGQGSALARALVRPASEGGSLLRAPAPPVRELKSGGLTVRARYSRNVPTRLVQRAYDKKTGHTPPTRRVARELAAEQRVTNAIERAPAAALARAGRKLTAPQQMALRVYHEGVPIEQVISRHKQWAREAKGAARMDLVKRISVLNAAKRYVETVDGKPVLHQQFKAPRVGVRKRGVGPGKLQAISDRIDRVAGDVPGGRERIFKDMGLLSEEQIAFRKNAPGRLLKGAEYRSPRRGAAESAAILKGADDSLTGLTAAEQGALAAAERTGIVGQEGFKGGRTRIPDTPVVAPPAMSRPQLFRGGVPKKPKSVTSSYTGGLRRKGNYRTDTSSLVAESAVEAQRYASVESLRQQVIKAGVRERPDTGDWVPVKTKSLSSENAAKLRQVVGRGEDTLRMSKLERDQAASAYRQFIDEAFPASKTLAHVPAGDKVPGVVWVPKKMLDGINSSAAQIINTSSGKSAAALKTFDTVQNVMKAVILYAKPGYVAPNVLGNVAFNIVQQGVHAPRNWGSALRIGRYGDDVAAGVDQVMGSGFARAIAHGTERGSLNKTVNKAGDAWGVITDQTFRRAAFLHEARKAGYTGKHGLARLLYDKAKRGDLKEVVGRASSAVVDYDRLSPFERDIVRRVVFVYPWLKGATVYGGHFLAEHPVQAAALSQVAEVGKEKARKDLGDVPSYARGVFKVGGSADKPLVVNPTGINNLGTPAQLIEIAKAAVGGGGGKSDAPINLLSPALGAGLEAAQKRDTFTGRALEGSSLEIFGKQLLSGTPQALLKQRLEQSGGDQGDRAYPYTPLTAAGQFVGGSSAPKYANRDVLNAQAKAEGLAKLEPGKRAARKVFEERSLFHEWAKITPGVKLDVDGRLPRKLRDAFNIEAERQAAYARASEGKQTATVEYHYARYEADLRLLVKHGMVTRERADEVLTNAADATLEELKDARAAISERYYQGEGGPLYYIGHARTVLREAGAPVGG